MTSAANESAKVVIIGGGIVGCSVLYWLAKLGWHDVMLLERRELTSGSTWHAAGNVTHFGHYFSITQLYINSIKTYLQAQQESGQAVDFHRTGSLRLATTAAELKAYERLVPMYDALDVAYRIVDYEEIRTIHPLLNTKGLYGAAYTPTDGHVDATNATYALAKAARKLGARIHRHRPVLSLLLNNKKEMWQLTTAEGDVHAEHVVLATSFWTRELVHSLGLDLPLYALEHHEIITGPVPQLQALDFEVPTVRDPYAPANTRQEGQSYLCGVYESEPKSWAVDGIPADFNEQLLPPDLDRLEPHLLRVVERLPSFADAGIKTINNGPICYTPDGCPLLGPVAQQPGLWLAAGFCVGIGTGGGSGQFLAQWMIDTKPPFELPIVYPSRFSAALTRTQCLEQIRHTYAQGYTLPG